MNESIFNFGHFKALKKLVLDNITIFRYFTPQKCPLTFSKISSNTAILSVGIRLIEKLRKNPFQNSPYIIQKSPYRVYSEHFFSSLLLFCNRKTPKNSTFPPNIAVFFILTFWKPFFLLQIRNC